MRKYLVILLVALTAASCAVSNATPTATVPTSGTA